MIFSLTLSRADAMSRMKTVTVSDLNNLSVYNEVLERIGKCQLSFVTIPRHPSRMLLRYPGLGIVFWILFCKPYR